MVTRDIRIFRFRDIGEYLGTRQLGAEARALLLPHIMEGAGRLVLDFAGVKVVSNSFADECLAKLLLTMPLDDLKRRTTFANVDDYARLNIAIALQRRLNAIARATAAPC